MPTSLDILHIVHLNINGLRNKLDSLQIFLIKHKIKVACISETKLSCSYPDNLLEIDGFSFIRLDRSGAGGGGLIIYFSSELQVQRSIPTNTLLECEHLSFNIFCNGNTVFNFVYIYRPPQSNVRPFLESLDLMLDSKPYCIL